MDGSLMDVAHVNAFHKLSQPTILSFCAKAKFLIIQFARSVE
jgi:hypothetical protein